MHHLPGRETLAFPARRITFWKASFSRASVQRLRGQWHGGTPVWGFVLLGILVAIPRGNLFAQRGFDTQFLQNFSNNVTNSVGQPIGPNPSSFVPFSLNGGSFNGRILGADPLVSATLGVTAGGLSSGYYYDLLTDQIALRRLLPQNPGGPSGSPALRDFYINPLSPFVSGWIPGPGSSPLEERLARLQRGELVDPREASLNSESDSSLESADANAARWRRAAQVVVLPSPAAVVEGNDAELELETVPDTDAKVTATFPAPPRGFAARGLNSRFGESLEPFSALRFAMRSSSGIPFTPLRPRESSADDGWNRGVPAEFAVPSDPAEIPSAFDPPLVLLARSQGWPDPSAVNSGEEAPAANRSSSAANSELATRTPFANSPFASAPPVHVAGATRGMPEVPPAVHASPMAGNVAAVSPARDALRIAKATPTPPPPPFDSSSIHLLASSSDALELALAGVAAEPAEAFSAVAKNTAAKTTTPLPSSPESAPTTQPASPIFNRAAQVALAPTRNLPRSDASSRASATQGWTRSNTSSRAADQSTASPALAQTAPTMAPARGATPRHAPSKYDFEGSTAAIDRMLLANNRVSAPASAAAKTYQSAATPREPVVRETPGTAEPSVASRSTPRTPRRSLASPASVAQRTQPVIPSARAMAAAALQPTPPTAGSVAASTQDARRSPSSSYPANANVRSSTSSLATSRPTTNRSTTNPPALQSTTKTSPSYAKTSRDSGTYGSPAYGKLTYGSPAYGNPTYGSATYGSPVYGSPANARVSYETPYGTVTYETPYGSATYGSPVYGSATESRAPKGTMGSNAVASAVPSTHQTASSRPPAVSRSSKSFAQWRSEQLAEAHRLFAEGERAWASGRPNTARQYFQQADRIRDAIAALP